MQAVVVSSVYQVPINAHDLIFFKTPANQPRAGALNCGSATAQLLGLITSTEGEAAAASNLPLPFEHIVDSVNQLHGPKFVSDESAPVSAKTLDDFIRNILPGFASFVLVTRLPPDEMGHYFAIAKDKLGNVYIIDPQTKEVAPGRDAMIRYIEKGELFNKLYYLKTEIPRNADEFNSLYVDAALSRLLGKSCAVGGRRVRLTRKNGKKTKKSRKQHGVRTRRRRH